MEKRVFVNSILVDYLHLLQNIFNFLGRSCIGIGMLCIYLEDLSICDNYTFCRITGELTKVYMRAAAIDGCNGIKKFWYVTLPNLKYDYQYVP